MFKFMISKKKKVVKTVPTEMITEEMRDAGVDETTVLVDGVFSVYKDGLFVRSYNLADHGEDASKLANQFALKIKGEVK